MFCLKRPLIIFPLVLLLPRFTVHKMHTSSAVPTAMPQQGPPPTSTFFAITRHLCRIGFIISLLQINRLSKQPVIHNIFLLRAMLSPAVTFTTAFFRVLLPPFPVDMSFFVVLSSIQGTFTSGFPAFVFLQKISGFRISINCFVRISGRDDMSFFLIVKSVPVIG